MDQPTKKETASTVELAASEPTEPTTTPTSLPEVLTVGEVAVLLRVSSKTVYRAVDSGKIPGAMRIGRALRFGRDVVLSWIAGRSTADQAQVTRPFPTSTTCPFCDGKTSIMHSEGDGVLYSCQREACERYDYSRMLQVLDDGTFCDAECAVNLGAALSLEVRNVGDCCHAKAVAPCGCVHTLESGNMSFFQALAALGATGVS